MQSLTVQADVVHRIQFCAGKFCANAAPLTMTQQLEFNQHFNEGNLLAAPSKRESDSIQKNPSLSTHSFAQNKHARSIRTQ
jgi:hypothetical protein